MRTRGYLIAIDDTANYYSSFGFLFKQLLTLLSSLTSAMIDAGHAAAVSLSCPTVSQSAHHVLRSIIRTIGPTVVASKHLASYTCDMESRLQNTAASSYQTRVYCVAQTLASRYDHRFILNTPTIPFSSSPLSLTLIQPLPIHQHPPIPTHCHHQYYSSLRNSCSFTYQCRKLLIIMSRFNRRKFHQI